MAPLIEFGGVDYVFDPAFFKAPVTQAQWEERIASFSVAHSYPHRVHVGKWQYFYRHEQMIANREGALEERKKLLALSRDWSDPTVFHGVLAKARGDWIDELAQNDLEGVRAIIDAGKYTPFGNWFYRVQSASALKQELMERDTYYGIPCRTILERIDLDDLLPALELRKVYWRYFLELFDVLRTKKREYIHGGDQSREWLFRSTFGDPDAEDDRDFRAWFSRRSEELWTGFGFDAKAFWVNFNSE